MKRMETLRIIIAAAAVIVAVLIGLGTWFLSGSGSAFYYTQIDNGRIREINSRGGVIDLHGGMRYSYTLCAFDESGEDKEVTFGTSRELKEGAFLRLTVMPVRGVVEWSEVKYDELPMAVQVKYPAAEENEDGTR